MKSIRKNFIFSTVLTIANYIFPLITYPYVSRILGVGNIGLVNFVSSIIQYFLIFSSLGIATLGVREIARTKDNRVELSKTYSALLTLNLIATLIMLLILVIVTLSVPKLNENWKLMTIGGFNLLFNVFLVEWLYKGLEDFKYITLRSIYVRIIYVIAIFVFVRERGDYHIYYLISTLMIFANAVINLCHSKKFVSISRINIRSFIVPFIVFGVYQILTSFYMTFNTVFLGFAVSEIEVGYYTTATKIYGLISAVYASFSTVLMPRMCNLIANKNQTEFNNMIGKSFNVLFLISFPLIILAIIDAPFIIQLIAGDEFSGAILPMRIIMPLMLVVGSEMILINQILMPLKKDKAVLINSLIGACMGIVINILLVSRFASVGSSIVLVSSEICVFVLAQFEVKKYINLNYPWKDLFKFILAYLPALVLSSFFRFYINNNIALFFTDVLLVSITFFVTLRNSNIIRLN